MEQGRIYLPDLLKELAETDFQSMETTDLCRLVVKVRVAVCTLENKGALMPAEMVMLNGFRFYYSKMENELKNRNCYIVEVGELLNQNRDLVQKVLRGYPIEKLVQLLDETEKMETPVLKTLYDMVRDEIARRSSNSFAEA